ncbi:MAG: type VI secretion system protein TssA [Burkholderiales bacterium]|nr:type VI secretion system protein TssA [Burkholderiales bacterium]
MNIETLLNPISDTLSCGEDLSFSADFDAIAEMRREDDPTLDQGEWVTALKTADWPAVEARCIDLLVSRSKDLRLAMWLAESAALNRGYVGLQQGLEVCAKLCERYWLGMHPQVEGGDMEERIGNISWLLHRIVGLATGAAVTRGRSGNYSLSQLHAARALQATLERSPEKAAQLSEDTVTLDKFNRALKETPKQVLLETLSALQACQAGLAAWQAVIDAQLGAEGPSFVPAREALDAALHETQRLAREMGVLQAATSPVMDTSDLFTVPVATQAAKGGGAVASGPLRSREQALMQLREVAAFFRATEPHSPVAYLADKAVHWGEMPLHEWLRAVVKEAGTLSHLEELLGVTGSREAGIGKEE